jgi:NDP-sugar pyrophosphorylase family protein
MGANCSIGEGSKIQKSVLWDDVVVGEGAVVRNSIISNGVILPPESQTEDKIVIRAEGDLSRVRYNEQVADYVVAPIKH